MTTIYVFLLTYVEHLWVVVVAAICMIIWWFIYRSLRSFDLIRYVITVIIIWSLSVWSVWRYQQRYESEVQTTINNAYIVTGVIEEHIRGDQYIFTDEDNSFLYQAKQQYDPGDLITSFARYHPAQTENPYEHLDLSRWTWPSMSTGWSFDYEKRQVMKGYQGVLYESTSIDRGSVTLSTDKAWRSIFTDQIVQTFGENELSWLILGMTIGDRSMIPPDRYDTFLKSGLVHIIAVSGGNLLMIVIFLGVALFFIPYYVRLVVILAVLIIYSSIVWWDSSVLRALVMGWLSIVALFAGKAVDIRRSMKIAYIGMLLRNPYLLVYDLWFLLSFWALTWIILLEPAKLMQWWIGIKKIRNEYILPSIGATMGVLPCIILFMGQINLATILANICVMPIVWVVMVVWFISPYVSNYPIMHRLIDLETILIRYIYTMSQWRTDHGIYLLVDDWRFRVWLIVVCLLAAIYLRYRDRVNFWVDSIQ